MDEFEKAGDDDFFIARRERLQHQPFGELVEREDHQRQHGDAAGGFLKNGLAAAIRQFQVSGFKVSMSNVKPCRRDFGLWTLAPNDYSSRMALVRILVDGYSLLHNWPELAPGRPRHSARARDELVDMLTRYHDATGTPITVFFDGAGAPRQRPKNESGTRGGGFVFARRPDGRRSD